MKETIKAYVERKINGLGRHEFECQLNEAIHELSANTYASENINQIIYFCNCIKHLKKYESKITILK